MFETRYVTCMDDYIVTRSTLDSLLDAIGKDSFHNFLHRFFDDCDIRCQRVSQAYKNNHFSEIELEVHTLGSAAATYGAHKLEELCREIEAAKPSKSKTFEDRIERLNALSAQSVEEIKDYLKDLDA